MRWRTPLFSGVFSNHENGEVGSGMGVARGAPKAENIVKIAVLKVTEKMANFIEKVTLY